MSERWQREVQKLRDVEPGPGVWDDAHTRTPHGGDGLPPTRQRLIAGVVAFAVFIGAGLFAWQAFRPSDGRLGSAAPGMVESGGTYRLFDVSVRGFLQDPTVGSASVSYRYKWTTEFFPGEAQCTFTLFDGTGAVLTDYQTGVVALSPTIPESGDDRPVTIEVPVPEGTPVTAEGTCEPGVVYEGPWGISNVRVEDSEVIGDVSLWGSNSKGAAACALRWTDFPGTEHITTRLMYVRSSRAQNFGRVPEGTSPDVVPQVRCESYQSPDQLAERHWLPWPETPDGSSASLNPNALLRGSGTVLQAKDDDVPVLCLGVVADSLPPQCDGIPIKGWDWRAVEGEETASGTTWGPYEVLGTYHGDTFTLDQVVGPPTYGGHEVDFTAPCDEPEGGWVPSDPSKASIDDFTLAMHAAEAEPDSTAVWIDQLDKTEGEQTGSFIGIFGFTGDLERHEAELRELWGGPICVFQQTTPMRELRRIQQDLGDGGAAAVGLEQTDSGIDVTTNVVEVGAIVTSEEIEQALANRYGDGTVRVVAALVPA